MEESISWVRRAKFSHTVCHRLDSSGIPLPRDPRLKPKSSSSSDLADLPYILKPKSSSSSSQPARSASLPKPKSSSSSSQPARSASLPKPNSSSSDSSTLPYRHDGDQKSKPKKASLDSSRFSFRQEEDTKTKPKSSLVYSPFVKIRTDPNHVKSALFTSRRKRNSKPKQRSSSPHPATPLSDAFKEARAERRRFSTPPPSRKGSQKGVFGRLFSRESRDHHMFTSPSPPETSPLQHLSCLRGHDKVKNRKETSWTRYFDHAGGRVTALENTDEWMVDLSKLYLGLRFASGAHSRLYHGMYKDQPVAVKIIRQPDDDENGVMAVRLEKQFTREVTLLSHLHHRNVIKLVAACKKPPVFCIITEYLSGGSLRAFLHKLEHKSLPLENLIAIALDIARGMEYIHSQGVIHCDLKPENILFDQDLCVKVADFGIACEEAYCDGLAEDPGTYRWMAPEMIKHKAYGRKVDVYSFGLVLWEMVSGRIPYEDMTPIQAAFAVVDKNLRPSIPSNCPAALRALIEQCWSLHPEKRPELWQIVKVLEQFKSALAQDGTLDLIPNLTTQDHKKRLIYWIQKLKPSHADGLGPSIPRLL